VHGVPRSTSAANDIQPLAVVPTPQRDYGDHTEQRCQGDGQFDDEGYHEFLPAAFICLLIKASQGSCQAGNGRKVDNNRLLAVSGRFDQKTIGRTLYTLNVQQPTYNE
jgi:hypothetical protein